MSYGIMRAAGKVAKGVKKAMKSSGQRRREEVKEILSPGNPLSRMNDAAKKAFARKNLK